MTDFSKLNFGSNIDGDKIAEIVEGVFTYNYTTADAGGLFTINNPQKNVLFLPFSIFSIDGGINWFTDMEGDYFNGYPDMLTCVTTAEIKYRWNWYGPAGPLTVMYKTALLAMDV